MVLLGRGSRVVFSRAGVRLRAGYVTSHTVAKGDRLSYDIFSMVLSTESVGSSRSLGRKLIAMTQRRLLRAGPLPEDCYRIGPRNSFWLIRSTHLSYVTGECPAGRDAHHAKVNRWVNRYSFHRTYLQPTCTHWQRFSKATSRTGSNKKHTLVLRPKQNAQQYLYSNYYC